MKVTKRLTASHLKTSNISLKAREDYLSLSNDIQLINRAYFIFTIRD